MDFTDKLRLPLRNHRLLSAVLLLYIVLAGIYSVVNPLFEAPDESWHYGYVHWLAGGNGLAQPDDRGGAGEQQWAQEGSQPPLYYLAAGLLTAPVTGQLAPSAWQESVRYNVHAAVGNADTLGNRNYLLHGGWDDWPWRDLALGAHLARLFSILLGAVTVVFAYAAGRLLAPGWSAVAPLAAALVAFTPQFLLISASVSNDNMITAVCSAGVWLSVALASGRVAARGRTIVLLGLLMGLAALSKLSGLLLWPFALLCIGGAAWRRRSWPLLLAGGLSAVAVGVAVSGWWYWRNWQLYGDPLGLSAMFAVGPARDEAAGLAELLALGPGVWRSAWAVFGWFNVTAPEWVYWLYTGLTAIALLGWVVLLAQGLPGRPPSRKTPFQEVPAALFALWSLAVAAALVRWAQINYPQGRLLFPAIAAAMPLLAVGLLAPWPPLWRRWIALSIGVGMALLAAVAPFAWIAPAYAPPLLVDASAVPPPSVDYRYGEHIHLIGYDYPSGTAKPGETVDITLYWRTDQPLPDDYSVFVHLVDELGIVQAQSDSHPALGGRPTSRWQPGDIIVDPHRLRLPTGLAPGFMWIQTGMYDYAGGERLVAAFDNYGYEIVADDGEIGLGTFEIPPQRSPAGIPNPTHINFGDQIALIGYDLRSRRVQPGGVLGVGLWFESLAPMQRDYVAFVHLTLPPDAVWAQLDRMPHPAPYNLLTPTSTWKVGQVVEDWFGLDIPPETPSGIYDVAIGWYDKDTYDRLAVDFDDSDVIIARVRVEP